MLITIEDDSITEVDSDALITATNSNHDYAGAVDAAIYRKAGPAFHGQIDNRVLLESDVAYAPAPVHLNDCPFRSVIFVVDNLSQPLHQVILAGFNKAEEQRLNVVTIPLLRTGAAAGRHETPQQALEELVEAIITFRFNKPRYVHRITVVVFDNSAASAYLRQALLA